MSCQSAEGFQLALHQDLLKSKLAQSGNLGLVNMAEVNKTAVFFPPRPFNK